MAEEYRFDFGSDAAADGLGDADATHAAGTAVVEASKSLKQIFSEGPNFAAAAAVLSKVQDQVCLALVPHLTTSHMNTTTMSCAMICHCNNKIKYNTNISIG